MYAEVQESLRISEKDTKTLLNHIDIARVEEHDVKFQELDVWPELHSERTPLTSV